MISWYNNFPSSCLFEITLSTNPRRSWKSSSIHKLHTLLCVYDTHTRKRFNYRPLSFLGSIGFVPRCSFFRWFYCALDVRRRNRATKLIPSEGTRGWPVIISVNRRGTTVSWPWSMQHKPGGAVLASCGKPGVRPRSSWLRESSWRDRGCVLLLLLWQVRGELHRMPVVFHDRPGRFPLVQRPEEAWPARRCCTYSTWTPAPPSPSTSSWHCRRKSSFISFFLSLSFFTLATRL